MKSVEERSLRYLAWALLLFLCLYLLGRPEMQRLFYALRFRFPGSG